MILNTKEINKKILIFVTGIAYPNYNSYLFILYMFTTYLGILKQQRYTLQSVNRTFLKNFINEGIVCDLNNTLIVNDKNGRSCLKFAVVYAQIHGHTIRRKVFLVTRKLESLNTAFVSFNLLHNLRGAVDCHVKEYNKNYIKFADEVELSLISSPNDWSNFVVDHCLKNYFKTPKILYRDDVIEINLNEYGKEIFHSSNKLVDINEKIYFKCKKVFYNGKKTADGYFCTSDKCTVRQTSNVQSFIPRTICNIKEDNEIPLHPDALNSYFEEMRSAVEPFITKKGLDFKPIFLLKGRKGSGKSLLVQSISSYFGIHLFTINNFEVTASVYAQGETKLKNVLFGAKMAAPCILQIKDFEHFGKNNEGQYDERIISHFTSETENFFQKNDFPVIVYCCCNEKNIPVHLQRIFLKSFLIKAPTEQEREMMLEWILKNENIQVNFDLNNIANKTHGFLFEDLRALIHYAVTDFCHDKTNNRISDLREEYFIKALDLMQSIYNESLGAPKVPKVKWSDVGGLNDVKEEIIKTIKLPLKHPKLLKQSGLKRSGILLYGPPGTGKTLIAKAVATECALCFLSVKGPELLNMYVGQSEQNVREVFERAREASPCIIFFDELDSLAPNRGASGDSGGVMDRVVSQLLAEMDGLGQSGTIFIIGATNRPDLIDPALLRPGRFDKLLYVGPCVDRDSKFAVLTALTKRFNLSDELVIKKVVDMCPENISGADFYGICACTWMTAVRRLISNTEKENGRKQIPAKLDDVIVTLDDFRSSIKNVKPSIKQEDLEYFQKLKLNSK